MTCSGAPQRALGAESQSCSTFTCVTASLKTPCCSALQSQKAVAAYFSSKQLMPFGFARQSSCRLLASAIAHVSSRGLRAHYPISGEPEDARRGMRTLAPLRRREKLTRCWFADEFKLATLAIPKPPLAPPLATRM